MLRYPVLVTFRDKYTKVIHEKGTEYETDEKSRAKELQDLAFIGKAFKVESAGDEWPKSVGGGYWELPNGERVRGKDNAIEALEALNAATDGEGGEADDSEANESSQV